VPADAPAASWGAVVPVKHLEVAKSRLAAYGDLARRELALAFAADVVTAALECPAVAQVLVVTDDASAATALAALGAVVVPDHPDAGLNPALDHGADLLRAAHPGLGVVTLSADLPALRSADLAQVLAAVPPGGRAFVADSAGTGTTLLAAAAPAALAPGFGAGSRRRHLDSGAVELRGTAALRRDVDTPEDLADALVLGVGRRTAAAAARVSALP
jgi:2-phospho-L-lactate guanylyltransferase